jgi:hypothetical protein
MPHGTRHGRHENHVEQPDLSVYMLGLPKSHPGLRNWCVFAILTGAILALAVVVLGNLIF